MAASWSAGGSVHCSSPVFVGGSHGLSFAVSGAPPPCFTGMVLFRGVYYRDGSVV